jgi:hypothetical protein
MKTLIVIAVLLYSCTTIKETTKTGIEIRTDTIYVINEEWEDSVKAFWEDSTTVTGIFLDSLNSRDTVLVVKYKPAETKFIVKKYLDTVLVIETDTVRITTTTLVEEPTMLEQWWWLILLVLVAVIAIIILIRR